VILPASEQTEVSDEALMLRYQRGERDAFVTLLRRYQVAVYNFVLRQLGSALLAGEIAQDVFLGVIREAARFDYETPFVTRLFTIAYRLVKEERSRLPGRRWRQQSTPPPESEHPGHELSPQHLEESISSAVASLPDEQRDVYLLREVADLPFSEIAVITRQSETAVKVQLQHALQRLRLALQDLDEYRRALR
jgi:RNA polymerase sigma-70 factor (ECF subfamily)